MRYGALILLALPAFAQISTKPAASPTAIVPKNAQSANRGAYAKIPLSSFVSIERAFDAKLSAIGAGGEPIEMLGPTRGLYLDGYGIVFTTEVGLVALPTVNPFNPTITDARKAQVHSAKVSRLAAVRKAAKEMATNIATTVGQVPDTQQVVVAVRLAYAPWENTSGLPGLIVAKADRRSAMAGNIQFEEQ